MPARKPVPRAVLEERLKVLEEKAARRRSFAVGMGSYLIVVLGVLASQVVILHRDLTTTLQPLELSQLAGGLLIAGFVFNRTEGQKKDLVGKAKKGNVGRALLAAFYNGFFWMTIVGAWW